MLLCSFLPFFLFSWVVLPIKIYKLSTSQSKYTGYINVEDTHRGNTPSKKTQALTKSMNIGIWEIVYQINYLKEVPKMKTNFQKKKVVSGKTVFCDRFIFLLPILFVAFDRTVLYGNNVN